MSADRIPILLVGHDRGGVNLLLPLLRRWIAPGSPFAPVFISTPTIQREVATMLQNGTGPGDTALGAVLPALSRPRASAVEGRRAWTLEAAEIEALIDRHGFAHVLTGTSLLASMEKDVWRICRDRGIACTAICDMWTEYEKRFLGPDGALLIDDILAIDERMRRQMDQLFAGKARLAVTGSPHFDALLRRDVATGANRWIRFISEPVAELFPQSGIHEFDVAETFIAAVRAVDRETPIALRPHPQDDSEGWRRFAHHFRGQGVFIDTEPSWMCHASTALALGMSSMLLIEMALAHIPVASFQPPYANPEYFCLEEDDFGIAILSDPAALESWLRAPARPRPEPALTVTHFGAVERISALILERVRA